MSEVTEFPTDTNELMGKVQAILEGKPFDVVINVLFNIAVIGTMQTTGDPDVLKQILADLIDAHKVRQEKSVGV